MSNSSLEDLKKLNYPIRIQFDAQDNVYTAEVADLPGCFASGDSVEDAYKNAEEAKNEWMRVALEEGLPIPQPKAADDYSGRILVRVPSDLHGRLSEQANQHGASLNQYIVHLLSGGVVGDSLIAEIEQLNKKMSQLEWRVSRLNTSLKSTYAPSRQTTSVVSTGYLAASNVAAAISGVSGITAGLNLATNPPFEGGISYTGDLSQSLGYISTFQEAGDTSEMVIGAQVGRQGTSTQRKRAGAAR